MKKMKKNVIIALALVLTCGCIFSGFAFAPKDGKTGQQLFTLMTADQTTTTAQTETIKDGAGNTISAGQDVPVTGDVENEAIAAGYTVSLKNSAVTSNAFLAGYSVTVEDSSIGGTAALAGNEVKINSPVANNIFAAGNIINLGEKTTGRALYAAGSVLDIKGAYEVVDLSGSTVNFNGTATGDVRIDGDKINIGDNAKIDGKLIVTSTVEPTIPSGASIGEYQFIKAATPDYENAIDVSTKATVGAKILSVVKSIIYWVIASAILSFIFCALFHKPLDDSKEMVTKKPVATLLTGFITLIALPVGLILTCITFVGLPVAGFVVSLAAPIMFFSTVFAASSFARFVFDKIKPGFNPVAASLLGTIIVVVVKNIPILGGLVGFVCMIYTMGYFVLVAYKQMKSFKLKREVIADVQSDVM